uniref:Uncharacterized protein n=1 Tax=Trichogramma kaykai TaxID=54128 RepID=A0ABD2VS92_9HYME
MVNIYSTFISCHQRNIRNFYGCAFDADCKATLLRAQNAEHSVARWLCTCSLSDANATTSASVQAQAVVAVFTLTSL